MFHCPGCGGQLRFDIPSGRMKCGHCAAHFSVADAENLNTAHAENGMEGYTYTCPNCGGEVFSVDSTATTFCSFCGSSVLLEARLTKETKPDRIVPFKITREQCVEKYKEYISNMFCVDRHMIDASVLDSFRAIYVPYCNYKTETHGMLIGEVSKTKGDKEYIYNITGQADYVNDWQLRDLSLALPDEHSERINEFSRDDSVPFAPAYLAGFYADLPDLKPGVYREEVMNANATDVAKAFFTANDETAFGDQLRKVAEQAKRVTHTSGEEFVLLPVWFMSFRYKERVCYAMVNGVTGKVTADLPVDYRRFIAYGAVASLIFFLLLAFGMNLVMKPGVTLAVASVVLAIITVLTRGQYKKMILRETETDRLKAADQAVREGKTVESKLKIKGKAAVTGLSVFVMSIVYGAFHFFQNGIRLPSFSSNTILAVIGFLAMAVAGAAALVGTPRKNKANLLAFLMTVIAFLMLVMNLSQDILIYLFSVLMLLVGIYCEYDMIHSYNAQCSNAIPVFDTHRGGENDA